MQLLYPLNHFRLNALGGIKNGLARGHIVGFGVDSKTRHLAKHFAGKWIKQRYGFDFLIKQLNADRLVLGIRRKHINHIAAHPIGSAAEIHIVASVLQFRQAPHNRALIHLVTPDQVQHHLEVGFGITEAINGRYRGHHNHIPALHQGLGGRQAHLLDMLVNGRVLLDKGIGRRHIGLGLVVVVVGNEVLHGIVREEILELAIQLGCQGFIVSQHNRRALDALNHIGNGEGLTRACHTQQGLRRKTCFNPLHQGFDRLGLIPGGLVRADNTEWLHGALPENTCRIIGKTAC